MGGGSGNGAESRLSTCSLTAPTPGARVARWEQTALSCKGALFHVKSGINLWNVEGGVGVSGCARKGTVPWAVCYGITPSCNWNCIAALLYAALDRCMLNGAALEHNKFSSLEKRWNYLRVNDGRGLWSLHDIVEVGNEAGGEGAGAPRALPDFPIPFPILPLIPHFPWGCDQGAVQRPPCELHPGGDGVHCVIDGSVRQWEGGVG